MKDESTMNQLTDEPVVTATTDNESEVERLRAELEAARGEVQSLKDEKALAVVHAKMRKIWRDTELIDDIAAQRSFAKLLLGVDEDGNPVVKDFDGRERVGVSIEQMVDDLVRRIPTLKRSSDADSDTPGARIARAEARDDLKTYKEKTAFIEKFGYAAWEALPTSRPNKG